MSRARRRLSFATYCTDSVRARALPAGKLWRQSQTICRPLPTLRSMGVKYYTHFVLTGEAAAGSDQEFSGVVEVNQATDQRYETKEIEALLARNFDLRSGDVRLINWARLQ
jgi:hypothetical protein